MSLRRRITADKRASPRRRILKGGVIAFSGRHATLNCVVRDISETGAKIQVDQASKVPDTFELLIELDGLDVPCKVAWRGPNEIGVAFTAMPKLVAPVRAQVVSDGSGVLTKPTLRRSRPQATPAPANTNVAMPPPSPEATAEPRPAPAALIPLLIVEDDPDDRMLIEAAFKESGFQHPIAFAEHGEEMLAHMRAEPPFEGRDLPGLILLDLNMPKMDGRTALMHLKTDPALKRTPVIVLTTSNAEEDIQRTYDLGVSAFIQKPNSFDGLMDLVDVLDNHWMRFVALPTLASR